MMHTVRPLTKQPIHVFAILNVINTSQESDSQNPKASLQLRWAIRFQDIAMGKELGRGKINL